MHGFYERIFQPFLARKDGVYRDNKDFFNQNQQMIDQKNHMDTAIAIVVHHLPKIVVDCELLWRCISKMWNQPKGNA